MYTVNLTVTDDIQEVDWDETTATITDVGGDTELEIESIKGGLTLRISIKNIGDNAAISGVVDISITGGFFIMNREYNYAIGDINPGESTPVPTSVLGIGLGLIKEQPLITVNASADNAPTVSESVNALILGPLVIVR